MSLPTFSILRSELAGLWQKIFCPDNGFQIMFILGLSQSGSLSPVVGISLGIKGSQDLRWFFEDWLPGVTVGVICYNA